MINSLDRISVATSDLERSKKIFNDFFDSSPAFEVEEKNLGYKSLIYNFENLGFLLTTSYFVFNPKKYIVKVDIKTNKPTIKVV